MTGQVTNEQMDDLYVQAERVRSVILDMVGDAPKDLALRYALIAAEQISAFARGDVQ